jgi:hypothetical protein
MIRGVHKNGKVATGNYTRRAIAREREIAAAKEEIEHGFRGPVSDDDMVRYARLLDIVNGPPPDSDGVDREPMGTDEGWY